MDLKSRFDRNNNFHQLIASVYSWSIIVQYSKFW